MILKASQRGGAKALGLHLLKAENEHVEIHEIRGFVSDDLLGAMKEAQGVAKGTRCKQFLFSVSLNPPAGEDVGIDVFERPIDQIEERNGLSGHLRCSRWSIRVCARSGKSARNLPPSASDLSRLKSARLTERSGSS